MRHRRHLSLARPAALAAAVVPVLAALCGCGGADTAGGLDDEPTPVQEIVGNPERFFGRTVVVEASVSNPTTIACGRWRTVGSS
jgi:hypothetical protein